MKYEIVNDPFGLVVSVEELKDGPLKIIHDRENGRLAVLSKAAEAFIENATDRFLLIREINAYFDDFQSVVIQHRPNVAIDSVRYKDISGTLTELDESAYQIDAVGLDTKISFPSYPALGDYPNPIVVNYSVGYGDAGDVPELLKYAIKGLALHWFLNSSPVVTGQNVTETPLHVESIINQFKVVTP